MRIVLSLLIGIHGVIHLFGFLKAFGLSEFKAISQPISVPLGILWLLAFLAFAAILVLMLIHCKFWWVMGFLAVLLSQVLIIIYWNDAKFGTVLNIIIFASVFIAYSANRFEKMVNTETIQMLSELELNDPDNNIVSEQTILKLPLIVQKWLLNSGTVGKEVVKTVFVEQNLKMLMKPEQKEWYNAIATQYFTTSPPAFNWSVNLKMFPLMNVSGRDKFENGKGEMTIKLLSFIPVVNARDNNKINEATLQRYLAEIVWFPSAAISPYITWEGLDNFSANATLEYNGTKGSGIFYFDENGVFKKFTTMRYKDIKDTKPTKWTVTATKTEVRNGITIPVESELDWELDSGNWTWLKLKITNILYNFN